MAIDFARTFQQAYSALGQRLTRRDAMPLSQIRAAEKRLGVVIPNCLREYYRVAGREAQFNTIFDRFLPPDEWFIDHKRLVFMEENQQVVFWGVPAVSEELNDPPVYHGVACGEIKWYREHRQCSAFLSVMLHWHGAFGGALPATSSALASIAMRKKLRHGWGFIGEVNHMQAFARPGKAVCHLKWDDGWRLFAGAVSQKELDEIAQELDLKWLAC